MAQHMLGSQVDLDFVDKRRSGVLGAEPDSLVTIDNTAAGTAIFTANAAGTTTTLVGANADPSTGTNVVRIGELFKLFAAGAEKEDTTFEVTAVAVDTPGAGSTTVTFTPAAAEATASGDEARLLDVFSILDETALDSLLTDINSTSYTTSRLTLMTQNDKVWAIRQEVDSGGI